MGSRKSKPPSGGSKGIEILALILAIAGVGLAGFQIISDINAPQRVYLAT